MPIYSSDDLPEGTDFQVVGDIKKLLEAEKGKQPDTNGAANGKSHASETAGNIIKFRNFTVSLF